MGNDLQYAQVLQQELDRQLSQQATSGWMEKNASQVRYSGGGEVKIPVCSMTGLGAYDRDSGKYPQGGITLKYETRKLTQDRAAQFYFDRNDVDESNYLVEAASVMAQFQREHVIPEVDAYRYSAIAKFAIENSRTAEEELATDNILSHILSVLRGLQDKTGIDKKEFVITMPFSIFELLEQSEELTRVMQVSEFDKGDVSTEVSSINGVPVIAVPGDRMFTEYTFSTGAEKTGFTKAATAKSINFIIMPKFAPLAVSKTDTLKIFSPDENQDGDGWKTQYRKYHDLWLKPSVATALYVSLEKPEA